MNGFFRANKANKFKETVWSVFSGLAQISDNVVYPMSNGGDIDSPVTMTDFRKRMNAGEFVSNTSTHIPIMLRNIIQNIDTAKKEVAVLVSDMKYSPMGKSAAPELSQYQEEIRNVIGNHPHISLSFICAISEFLAPNGSIVQENSPYYFIIIGKAENVAAMRNDIARWCEGKNSYVESGDMCMTYQTPDYTIEEVKNGMKHNGYPNNVITTFDRDVSDTCSFIVRINMNAYPWGVVRADVLKDFFNAKAVNGSSVKFELLNTPEHLVDNHAYKHEFERCSYADFLVKLYDVALDDEVIEWTFTNPHFGVRYTTDFYDMITTEDENDLSGTFSFNKFLEGCFNARLNTYNEEPVRVLVSSADN
ncbi:MAG: hypothetical protein NC252_06270 [Roseburia sp.]|nr:hypothetical protein [Roseburia sp.]MCM1420708.1 hypothetical protein [Bacteroides sp.]